MAKGPAGKDCLVERMESSKRYLSVENSNLLGAFTADHVSKKIVVSKFGCMHMDKILGSLLRLLGCEPSKCQNTKTQTCSYLSKITIEHALIGSLFPPYFLCSADKTTVTTYSAMASKGPQVISSTPAVPLSGKEFSKREARGWRQSTP
jgi:hypothetical protein